MAQALCPPHLTSEMCPLPLAPTTSVKLPRFYCLCISHPQQKCTCVLIIFSLSCLTSIEGHSVHHLPRVTATPHSGAVFKARIIDWAEYPSGNIKVPAQVMRMVLTLVLDISTLIDPYLMCLFTQEQKDVGRPKKSCTAGVLKQWVTCSHV